MCGTRLKRCFGQLEAACDGKRVRGQTDRSAAGTPLGIGNCGLRIADCGLAIAAAGTPLGIGDWGPELQITNEELADRGSAYSEEQLGNKLIGNAPADR